MLLSMLLTIFTFVELNCENLFDCRHDSLKQDYEFCEGGMRNWHHGRYWRKVNNIGREIIACGGEGDDWNLPDMVALVEVENDSVMTMLTKRSLLNRAHYEYVMTNSADVRGIDVALLYSPSSFHLDSYYSIRVQMPANERPTRDILYAKGSVPSVIIPNESSNFSTLHVFVVHAPSRTGGEKETEYLRQCVSNRLCQSIDSIHSIESDANIIVAGDFNDYYNNSSVLLLSDHGMYNISAGSKGNNGAKGTYRYRGEWGSLDQILISESLIKRSQNAKCFINDLPFLVEEDDKYGGIRPRRTFVGPKYDADGFSDHLPLVLKLSWK